MNFTSEQIATLKNYVAKLQPSTWGKVAFYAFPFRKRVILKNLTTVFGTVLASDEIQKLAKAFYGHLLKSMKETLLLRVIPLEKLKARVEIKGQEHMWDLLDQKVKGAILITGHFGSWEFAPIAGMLHFPEFRNRFYFVRKMLRNKRLERFLFQRYHQAGLQVIPKKNSLDRVCDVLENNNAVIFVLDQHASLENRDGILVDFFGKPAGTYKSPALIARYTNVPVLPVRSYRKPNGKHILEFFPKLSWVKCENENQEILENTLIYNRWLEKFILEYPEQWLWMHKRWKVSKKR